MVHCLIVSLYFSITIKVRGLGPRGLQIDLGLTPGPCHLQGDSHGQHLPLLPDLAGLCCLGQASPKLQPHLPKSCFIPRAPKGTGFEHYVFFKSIPLNKLIFQENFIAALEKTGNAE